MPVWDLPSPREELDRKTLEALERLERLAAAGKIGPGVLMLAVQSIWTAVSGLVSEDVTAVISDMSRKARRAAKA